jgi:hypothetical protein
VIQQRYNQRIKDLLEHVQHGFDARPCVQVARVP